MGVVRTRGTIISIAACSCSSLQAKGSLVLRSLKVVHKSATSVTRGTSRSAPHPRLGTSVQLLRCNLGRVFNLVCICEGLPGKCFTAEQTPPRLLQIEPTGAFRDKDVMHPRVSGKPFLNRLAGMARQVVGDQIQLAFRIRSVDYVQQSQIS